MGKNNTAVDILYNFLFKMESFEGFDPYDFNQEEVFKIAKEIEKEQIEDAWYNSDDRDKFEKYYNETYNQ